MNLADMFTVVSMTNSVNKLPRPPTMVGDMGIFDDKGVRSTDVMVEEAKGRLHLVENISRKDEPIPRKKDKRARRTFQTLHLPDADVILPSELQNIPSFGSENLKNPEVEVINDRLQQLKNNIETTREFMRVGALRGRLLDARGDLLYDLFQEFGVQKHTVAVPFNVAETNMRELCTHVRRHTKNKMHGLANQGVGVLCGKAFWDELVKHPSVEKAYLGWEAAADKLARDLREEGFEFGGLKFREYDIEVDSQQFIPDDVAQVFPLDPNAYAMFNAPAEYNEAINTLGVPYYAKGTERPKGKGWDLDVESNPLAMTLYPEALVEMKIA
uniref:Phage major capsid protein E n=1 Tax=Candidatus Kentrum sp. LPFa TaxID=2126335 RepID=A0A450WZX6_9GAMM|nr:MAG: Phage major capsid protein E [Candidatus Kentron sp. LPFa]